MHQGMEHEPIIRFPEIEDTRHPNRKNGKLFQ